MNAPVVGQVWQKTVYRDWPGIAVDDTVRFRALPDVQVRRVDDVVVQMRGGGLLRTWVYWRWCRPDQARVYRCRLDTWQRWARGAELVRDEETAA